MNWNAPDHVKKSWSNILDEVFEYWLADDGPDGKSLGEDASVADLKARLLECISSEHCKYWKTLLQILVKDIDM
eukprot:12381767-Karenia_brevis.AAC.1